MNEHGTLSLLLSIITPVLLLALSMIMNNVKESLKDIEVRLREIEKQVAIHDEKIK